ncbi:MAG: ATP-binding protein [Gemmatimonadota bacterium]
MSEADDRIPSAARFEGLGTFYLGSVRSRPGAEASAEDERVDPFLYDAKDLTTHAVALGMTGSGKTGLCITLIEEAALDGVPTIAVDLKGDIANLMLTFPDLAPEDFLPWIDEAEAAREGRTPEEQAEATATLWREGLAGSGQDGARIRRLKEAAEATVYTPGATHGRPLAVLRSFAAPSEAVRGDADALGDRVMSAVSGLLALVGREADPLQSREHILLSRILHDRWKAGEDLDLAGLIHAVQEPGFDELGVMDIESFFPADDRFAFAAQLNNLIAAPGFDAWLQGDPLDIRSLLWTPEGRPRISIVSVAHLDDAERMFFLTTLLNEILAWVRSQAGSSSLRALLYIDEVFGYLPPTAKPPTKPPLLSLLKQARAFGFGVVLSTQNPVDLDYKALSNAGTWFLGRLQTERDKMRVLDGLESVEAMSGPGGLDRKELDGLLSDLDKRVFLVNNVHEGAPVLIRTRWAMSYLRGPLARPEIARFTRERNGADAAGTAERRAKESAPATTGDAPAGGTAADTTSGGGARPMVPPKITQLFLEGGPGPYRPALFGQAELHYTKRGVDLDHWTQVYCLVELGDELPADPWESAVVPSSPPRFSDTPAGGAEFLPLPAGAADPAAYDSIEKRFESWLYRERRLRLRSCEALDLTSSPGEPEADFSLRVQAKARAERDRAVEELREKYAKKVEWLEKRIRTAEDRVEREAAQYEQHRNQGIVRLGSSILGAFLGRKTVSKTNLNKLSTAANTFGRASKHKDDVDRAEEKVEGLRAELDALEAEMEEELAEVREAWDPKRLDIEEVEVAPRKSDIGIRRLGLAWVRGSVGG